MKRIRPSPWGGNVRIHPWPVNAFIVYQLLPVMPDPHNSCSGAAPGFNFSASLNHRMTLTVSHAGPTPMPMPHALPTLRVRNGEDAYVFVAIVPSGAKSNSACLRRSMSSTGEDVDLEADASANATVAEKSGTGRWRWWMFGFGSTCRVDVIGVAVGAVDRRVTGP